MQFGLFSVGDVTPDPTTGRTPSEHERIQAMTAIALKAEASRQSLEVHPQRPGGGGEDRGERFILTRRARRRIRQRASP